MSSAEHLPTRRSRNGVNNESGNESDTGIYRNISLSDLETKYELLDVDLNSGTITVSEPGTSVRLADNKELEPGAAVSQGEISGNGATLWRRNRQTDYNRDLVGAQALNTYREMKNDAIIRSSLKIAKTPILSARWFMEPASDEPLDIYISEFIWKNLTEWMSIGWPQFLVESLYMLDYGVYAFEKVFEIRDVPGMDGAAPEQRVIWKKFAPRIPYEIEEFVYDDEGGPDLIKISTNNGPVDLPIAKALIFTYDKEAGDLWGTSLLRSAYKHWFFKEQLYKIDAIQKERHGIGIPVIKLPPNFTANDRVAAQRIGESLRTNERAHVVLPPGWEVMFLKLEGQRVDALQSAQHHAEKLYENVLGNFMLNNNASNDADVQEHVFTRATRFTAEIIRDVLNKYAIQQLIDFNWTPEELPNGYPQLKVRRLGDERDWRVISFAARNLVGADIIKPDDRLEAWFREELDMPVADIDTMRQVVEEVGMEQDDPDSAYTDDEPNVTGAKAVTRQSNARNSQQGKTTGNIRGDNSGTSS